MPLPGTGWPHTETAWPHTVEDYAFYHLGGSLAFLLLNAVFSAAARRASLWLDAFQPHMESQNRESFHRQLCQLLWASARTQLALVSLIGVWAWILGSGPLGGLGGLFGADWNQSPTHLLPRSGNAPSSCAAPSKPTAPSEYLRLTADIQLALALAMLMYHAFLLAPIATLLVWLRSYEQLEAGKPPASPGDRSSLRRIDAMRSQLLTACKSDPETMAHVAADRGNELRGTVDGGNLCVSCYLGEFVRHSAAALVDFTPGTWAIIIGYLCLLCAMIDWCTPYTQLLDAVDIVWYAASAYLTYRLYLHGILLRQGARQGVLETTWPRPKMRTAWPHAQWDQLTFALVGPGATGFVPFRDRPSADIAIRFIQAMLWLHFFRLGQYAANPFIWHSPSITIVWDLAKSIVPKLLCLCLWGLFLLPGLIEVFALPPFCEREAFGLLLHTLRAFPAGRPRYADNPNAQREEIVLQPLQKDRGLRRVWRWLWGTAPPPDPVQRLADHAAWITDNAEGAAARPRVAGALSLEWRPTGTPRCERAAAPSSASGAPEPASPALRMLRGAALL